MDRAIELVRKIACCNTLGEGVTWNSQSQQLLWTDIEGRQFFRSELASDEVKTVPTPERLASFGLLSGSDDSIVAAFESGFAVFALDSGDLDWIDRPDLPASVRFNDGRTDRMGRFWAGTMIEDPKRRKNAHGQLFRLDPKTGAKPVIANLQISNGLCWSPDGSVMYLADSPRRLIWSFDYASGEPENRRIFAETRSGAYPDGSTVDADGYVWNAQWGSSEIVRYAPDGRVDFVLTTPAPHVSCVAFGGPELRHLLVTTARAELSPQALAAAPSSGDLLIYETNFRGLPESRCTLPSSS